MQSFWIGRLKKIIVEIKIPYLYKKYPFSVKKNMESQEAYVKHREIICQYYKCHSWYQMRFYLWVRNLRICWKGRGAFLRGWKCTVHGLISATGSCKHLLPFASLCNRSRERPTLEKSDSMSLSNENTNIFQLRQQSHSANRQTL